MLGWRGWVFLYLRALGESFVQYLKAFERLEKDKLETKDTAEQRLEDLAGVGIKWVCNIPGNEQSRFSFARNIRSI